MKIYVWLLVTRAAWCQEKQIGSDFRLTNVPFEAVLPNKIPLQALVTKKYIFKVAAQD